jgi:hypothetical protein
MMDIISIGALVGGGLLYTGIGYVKNYIESEEPFDIKRLITQIPPIIIGYFFAIIPLIPTLNLADPWAAFSFGFMGKWATDKVVSIYGAAKNR